MSFCFNINNSKKWERANFDIEVIFSLSGEYEVETGETAFCGIGPYTLNAPGLPGEVTLTPILPLST